MSASIDTARFSEHVNNCPTMNCPGETFLVDELYLPIADSTVHPPDFGSHAVNVLFEKIVDGPVETEGDVLIFLSGASEIDACVKKFVREQKRRAIWW
jgi:ATP-dependent helicase HrpA